ncbi:YihY/virulence factor BrkB family protein [Marivirga atlantica]|uniref:YihY/virulence factor BrkB family protein n=1 Tax=Marivirga atlantica TaxID=1548457 RepID=A0A937DJ95_9BACT|nr:YihY/virulence factor BrkB family protein [Marivirga atlantica]MBL0765770.1 YihY/virulence factor BrkB family protein [Marivirga atlantica]
MTAKLIDYLKLVPKSIKALNVKNPLQLASSTAFFSVLAIPPILVILVSAIGIFVKPDYLNTEIFNRISAIMGGTESEELRKLFKGFNDFSGDTWASIGVFAFLLFIATNLFFLLELNINHIWDIPSETNVNFIQHLYGRLTSIFLLVIGGAVLILALSFDVAVSYIDEQIAYLLPEIKSYVVPLINQVFSLLTFGIWYTLLFKILPNTKLEWKPALFGGIIMALLFKLGQGVISNVLISGSIKTVFAASGSIVLVMLFIFYTSFIFYFVAMLIKQYTILIGRPFKGLSNNKASH